MYLTDQKVKGQGISFLAVLRPSDSLQGRTLSQIGWVRLSRQESPGPIRTTSWSQITAVYSNAAKPQGISAHLLDQRAPIAQRGVQATGHLEGVGH